MKNCKFVKSVAKSEDILKDKFFEVAFVGRSNVGKSSLINAIFNNRTLAKTSSTQGHTKLINYFLVDNNFYLVDLPGYGFHKAGKGNEENWSNLIEDYFKEKEDNKLILLLLDIRIKPSEQDKQMLKFLNFYSLPFKIIATKSDKIAKSKRNNQKLMLASEMNVGLDDILYISSDTKENIDKLKNLIIERVK
ncbi:MAG: YihA family ribosome biogenesis GTP-binding protein [Clostridiales bacterium]|nr:YihA family ribosome biogenesis GTP-binding protein [Clostridiales bacterium]